MEETKQSNVGAWVREQSWRLWKQKYRRKFKKQWDSGVFIVIASICLYDQSTQEKEIVSLGLGTKSLPQSVVNNHDSRKLLVDMHAQMLAVRGFRKFILKQLNGEQSIYFQWVQNKKKFKFKGQYRVVLYCSQIFCGDCCINQKQESFSGSKPLRYFNSENYPEAKYESNILRTKPGRLDLPKAKRSALLSCSDMFALFNLVGIQGDQLFSQILPVYLSMVVVDCPVKLRDNVRKGMDFVSRLAQLLKRSETLIKRQIFNVVVEGKQRKVTNQFIRNKPKVIVVEKDDLNKTRNQEGFDLCGIFTPTDDEWITGKSGLPEGCSLNNFIQKGRMSLFSDHRLQSQFPTFKIGKDHFKYEAVQYRLRLLFGQWSFDK